ncbi:hypothetical protein MPSEU_000965900 [Mayamaea pseudoterrestris]|nr:hypothetical protein MPSEU_000965200 [Mayamaea pseudoterrestris]GKZ00125.1 hypothetical protein MPSEU_000965900 [Mayamaea pseudoterrestris]
MRMNAPKLLAAAAGVLFTLGASSAFDLQRQTTIQRNHHRFSFSKLQATQRQTPVSENRRRELLSRKGPYFKLDKSTGHIEFGATANLQTLLVERDDRHTIRHWLNDTVGLARSIWDPKLLSQIDRHIFRLQVMTLQFFTIQLSPTVDVEMKTLVSRVTGDPIFSLQSVDYNPNVQVLGLPGLTVTPASLNVSIQVFGQMKPSSNGRGVFGAIAFATKGVLPLPLRLLPEPTIRAASNVVNQAVVNFAVTSFQTGAKQNFDEFRSKQRQ